MNEPLKAILVQEKDKGNGDLLTDEVRLLRTGALAWEHFDAGAESSTTVEPDWVGTALLVLIKERFKSQEEFAKWLKTAGVPSETAAE